MKIAKFPTEVVRLQRLQTLNDELNECTAILQELSLQRARIDARLAKVSDLQKLIFREWFHAHINHKNNNNEATHAS